MPCCIIFRRGRCADAKKRAGVDWIKIVWSCLQPGSIPKGAWLHRDILSPVNLRVLSSKTCSSRKSANFSAQPAEKPCCQTDMQSFSSFVLGIWASCKSSCLINTKSTELAELKHPNLTYEAMCPAIIVLPCCLEAPVNHLLSKWCMIYLLTNVEYNGI